MCWHWGTVVVWRLHSVILTSWWPLVYADAMSYAQVCHVYAPAKRPMQRLQGLFQPLPTPEHPWQIISMDFTEDMPASQGREAVLVVVDVFTKVAIFVPLKRLPLAPRTMWLFLQHTFRCHGLPWAVWGQTEGASSLPAGGNFWVCWGCNAVFTTHITHSQIARPSRWTRSWSSISGVILIAIRMTGLPATADRICLQQQCPVFQAADPFLRAIWSIPVTTQLCWGSCPGVFPWGLPCQQLQRIHLSPQEQLQKAQAAFKDYTDRHLQPALDFVARDCVWLSSQDVVQCILLVGWTTVTWAHIKSWTGLVQLCFICSFHMVSGVTLLFTPLC